MNVAKGLALAAVALVAAFMLWLLVARFIVFNTDACPWPWQRVDQPREEPGVCISPQG